MIKLYRKIFLIVCLLVPVHSMYAQKTDVPAIGAQVFIEPGQTPELIDSWFSCLEENNMPFARIRMFGSHIMQDNGEWDFSLYDYAFESAERHGIRLFVTLFPKTDELRDVGGFKFPRTEEHLEEIGEYIDSVVTHFRDKKAMYAWVLQNEPGTGSMSVPETELSSALKKEWRRQNQSVPRDGYLKADWSEQDFLVYYTIWYLNWISERVSKHDPEHHRHINPHQILDLLPEYDFASLEKILTSLGASMHLSWHFSYFSRSEYPLGISLMADIIRGSALGNPFWITELQGGNVTASGNEVLCPTEDEVAQWLWTGIGAGAEGIIFWTLNQRAAVNEAGEWGLLDFQGRASDRLEAASRVAGILEANADLMSVARPCSSDISILYNTSSLWIQRLNHSLLKDMEHEGRSRAAVMKSVAAAYGAVSAWGITPEVGDMRFYDWENAAGRAVILPNIIGIPSEYYDKIRRFVEKGGRIIVTGLTGFYDENMRCAFMGYFPLADVFGAELSEVKAGGDYFVLPECDGISLESHLWRSVLKPLSADILSEKDGEVYAVRNGYGKGEVIWLPSLVDLGNWHRDESALSRFYGKELKSNISSSPFSLLHPVNGVMTRVMTAGDKLVIVTVNKTEKDVVLKSSTKYRYSSTIYDNKCRIPCRKNGVMRLKPQECAVTVWNR